MVTLNTWLLHFFVPFYFWLAVFANMKENRCMQMSGKRFLSVQYSCANQQIQTNTKCGSSYIGKNTPGKTKCAFKVIQLYSHTFWTDTIITIYKDILVRMSFQMEALNPTQGNKMLWLVKQSLRYIMINLKFRVSGGCSIIPMLRFKNAFLK